MYKIAVLASTNGTNFQSLIDAKNRGELENIEIACLITNKVNCGAVEKAVAAEIQVHAVNPKGKSREEFDREIMRILEGYEVDLIVLGGYMRIIGKEMVERYRNKIINVHPSLLPKFAGGMDSDVHQAVIDAGESESGMTIHIVSEELDEGPIILQKSVEVSPNETPNTLKEKVQALEKEWYPKVVQDFAEGKFEK